MNNYLEKVISAYSANELVQICKGLNKSYNVYDPEEVRWNQISYALFKTGNEDINKLKENFLSNEVVNYLIFNYYICERVVKYHFIKYLKNMTGHIVAFEMSIGDSRIDICRINGNSYAYEIKTEYDTFDRLESQMHDYTKTFDKVYVIIPRNRITDVLSHIPDSCGIISYRVSKEGALTFSYVKKAKKNQCNPIWCLNSLSSAELSNLLRALKLGSCRTRSEKLDILIRYSEETSIWKAYREILRAKYEAHWTFLTTHFDEILPLDVQSFFSANLDPTLLYSK